MTSGKAGAGGGMPVNQAELHKMARERLKDARALLKGKRWAYAYYVAGYAVECALKSCLLARVVHTGWVFREKVKVEECLTHDFGKLVQLAGLTEELNDNLAGSGAAGGAFAGNWGTVIRWKVTSRYEPKKKVEALALYAAITNQPHGVLLWIKNYW